MFTVMGCDFCGISATTELYVQCMRHKACNECYKHEQRKRSAGEPCVLCLRDEVCKLIKPVRATKQKSRTLKRPASIEREFSGMSKSKSELSTDSDPEDLNGLNEELERLLTVAPPARIDEQLPFTSIDEQIKYGTEVPSGVCPPPSSTETSPRSNNFGDRSVNKNVVKRPYFPRHQIKRRCRPTFITQYLTEEEDPDSDCCVDEQDMTRESDLKQKQEKGKYKKEGWCAEEDNIESTRDRSEGTSGVHFKGFLIETEHADNKSECGEGLCASSSSSSEDQPGNVHPGNRERVPSEKKLLHDQRSMTAKVITGVKSWKQSSCISISGDTDDEDLDLTDLEKKISVINLQAPYAKCQARPTGRRRNPRHSKSEHSLASLEEVQEHDGSDHDLLYLGRHEPTGELAHRQKDLLNEWARKQEIREKQQAEDAKQTTLEKNPIGDALNGKSDGETPPLKDAPKGATPCSESATVNIGIQETLEVCPASGGNNDAGVEGEDSLKESLMAALRAAVRQDDAERFGCEGLPDPEDFWT